MGGIFFAKDKIKSILSGCYFFTDRDTAGPVCSLRVYRAHACLRFLKTCCHCTRNESNNYRSFLGGWSDKIQSKTLGCGHGLYAYHVYSDPVSCLHIHSADHSPGLIDETSQLIECSGVNKF
jgi:hypothetical protein